VPQGGSGDKLCSKLSATLSAGAAAIASLGVLEGPRAGSGGPGDESICETGWAVLVGEVEVMAWDNVQLFLASVQGSCLRVHRALCIPDAPCCHAGHRILFQQIDRHGGDVWVCNAQHCCCQGRARKQPCQAGHWSTKLVDLQFMGEGTYIVINQPLLAVLLLAVLLHSPWSHFHTLVPR